MAPVMLHRKNESGLSYRAAGFVPSTVNEAERTVEVTWTTGAAVKRYDSRLGGYYWEELEVSRSAIDMTRLNSGAPVLSNHSSWDLSSVIGVVVKADAKGSATLRFASEESDPQAESVFRKVREGILRSVSVGYVVTEQKRLKDRDGIPVYRATKWTPYEISIVPMPADAGASIRSQGHNMKIKLILRDGSTVEVEKDSQEHLDHLAQGARAADGIEVRSAPAPASAPTPPPAPPAPVAPAALDTRAVVEDALRVERERSSAIRRHATALKLPAAFADGLVERGVSLDDAREQILTEAARAQADRPLPSVQVGITVDQVDTERRGIENVLAHAILPNIVQLEPASAAFRSHGLLSAARWCLESQGVRTAHMAPVDIAEQAMKQRSQHSTSDFPLLLESTALRTVMSSYQAVPRTFVKFAKRDDARDYRPRTMVQTSIPTLPKKVAQGANYDRGTFTENGESWKVEHEGIVMGVTLQAIANDDLSQLQQITNRFGAGSSLAESRDFYQHLCGNPTMGDSVALFNTTSRGASGGNTAAGSLANTTALKAAWKWMRLAKDAGGNPIMVIPKFLVVASSLEVDAEALFSATYTATAPSGVNPFDGRGGIAKPIIIGDPHIDAYGTATMHFLIADPATIDTIVYGYISGKEGPQVTTQTNFNNGGLDFKLTQNFGVKAADWRGMYQFT